MRKILLLFLKAEGINSWTVLGCLLAASVAEGIGFASLVPLLSVATDRAEGDTSPITEFAGDLLGGFGLSLDLGTLVIFLVTMLLLKSALTYFAMRRVGFAIAGLSTTLRLRLIQNLLQVRWDYLMRQPVGRMAAAMSSQAEHAGKAYRLAAVFFAQAIQTTAYLAVAFVVSWPLALCSVAVGGGMAGILHSLVRVSRKAGVRRTRYTRELVVFLMDTFNNIKPLKAMSKQNAFADLCRDKIDLLNRALRTEVASGEALKNGSEMLAVASLGVAAFFALVVWQMELVDLLVVGLLLKRTTSGIAKMQHQFQQAVTVHPPYKEITGLIKEAAAAREANPGRRRATFEQGCVLQNVDFTYGEHDVLHSASVTIPTGAITVMTGPSGAGKTTLVDLILGLHVPSNGRVLLDGVPLREIDLDGWRTMVGYVPQELSLFHDTVRANIVLGDQSIGNDRIRAALEGAGAWNFVERLPEGLETVVGEKGSKLSGGERQRIAIARALVAQPKLLILDEVTSALDPETERQICHNIRSLAGQTTILAITHRPAFLEIADVVYRVYDGQVVEQAKSAPITAASYA